MERVIKLHVQKLPEGLYLATSDEVQGLVAQGRTTHEAVEIARDIAMDLIGAQQGERVSFVVEVAHALPRPAVPESGFGMVKVSGPAVSPDFDVAGLLNPESAKPRKIT